MRIAFISYEYPLDTNGGGIGTYLRQVAGLLASTGHEVEVFCGTPGASRTAGDNGCTVRLIHSAGSPFFKDEVLEPFTHCHAAKAYDVVEGCDFDASAVQIKRKFPALPYVVKLHTPRFFVDELHHVPTRALHRLRILLGSLRRGRWPRPIPIRATAAAREEIAAITLADQVAAPCEAIARLAGEWCGGQLPPTLVFPYPFVPSPELLTPDPDRVTTRVSFIGRIETRKGVLDLAAAIPLVTSTFPGVRFRFVGREQPSPDPALGMHAYLRRQLAGEPVEIFGPVSPTEIPRLLGETDIAVFPSHWENHALVCCEALAAGCAVVASNSGGMAEILKQGACGLLAPPHDPTQLAAAICRLLADPEERKRLGRAGRRRILEDYSLERVLPQQLDCYRAAQLRCRTNPPPAS